MWINGKFYPVKSPDGDPGTGGDDPNKKNTTVTIADPAKFDAMAKELEQLKAEKAEREKKAKEDEEARKIAEAKTAEEVAKLKEQFEKERKDKEEKDKADAKAVRDGVLRERVDLILERSGVKTKYTKHFIVNIDDVLGADGKISDEKMKPLVEAFKKDNPELLENASSQKGVGAFGSTGLGPAGDPGAKKKSEAMVRRDAFLELLKPQNN